MNDDNVAAVRNAYAVARTERSGGLSATVGRLSEVQISEVQI
jgi:hypothetical protein